MNFYKKNWGRIQNTLLSPLGKDPFTSDARTVAWRASSSEPTSYITIIIPTATAIVPNTMQKPSNFTFCANLIRASIII